MTIKTGSAENFIKNKGDGFESNKYNQRKVELLKSGTMEYYYASDKDGFVGEILLYWEAADRSVADGKDNCYVGDLYVIPEKRNNGVGTALLKYAVENARERFFDAVNLHVEYDNPALNLYKKNGFEDTGKIMVWDSIFPEIKHDGDIHLLKLKLRK